MNIAWGTQQRKLKDLKDYDKNPRKMDKDEFNNLIKSIQQDGYHQRLLINVDNTIIGGHQRKKAMLKAGYKPNDIIEVLVPNRLLEGDDFDRLNIRDNLPYGSFDFDMLANNFDSERLIEWGFPPLMLGNSILKMNEEVPDKIKEIKAKTCPHCGELL